MPAEPGPNAVVPKVLNAAVATSNITTGSVPQPATAAAPAAGFGPAKVTAAAPAAATGPRAIVIGATDSLDSLRVRWGELTERNAEELKALAPRYRLAADAKGAPFTLLAGPFESNADATRTCNALRAKGVACRVGDYTGSAF